jgi:transcriptional regulator with XRE-family HTH domain
MSEVKGAEGPAQLMDLLRRERDRLGLSQSQMAAKMGVTRTAISGWEMGALGHAMKPETIARLEEVTGIPEIYWLRAMGYRINLGESPEARLLGARAMHLNEQELELLRIFRPLRPEMRDLVLRIIQQLAPPTRPSSAKSAPTRRPRK